MKHTELAAAPAPTAASELASLSSAGAKSATGGGR